MTFALFRVRRDDERTRLEGTGDVLGWGVETPTGRCFVEWRRTAFEEPDRLNHPHMSEYGSRADVEQGTGGNVEIITEAEP